MEKVQELLGIIKQNKTCSSSKKDEVQVMRAMMNDSTYSVETYSNSEEPKKYYPAKEFKSLCASIISDAGKIPECEANDLMSKYEFKKSEADAMVNFSKEFVNTYLQSGRKLSLGGREKSNVALALKEVPAGERTFPKLDHVSKDGTKVYVTGKSFVKGYESIKVFAPAPSWLK